MDCWQSCCWSCCQCQKRVRCVVSMTGGSPLLHQKALHIPVWWVLLLLRTPMEGPSVGLWASLGLQLVWLMFSGNKIDFVYRYLNVICKLLNGLLPLKSHHVQLMSQLYVIWSHRWVEVFFKLEVYIVQVHILFSCTCDCNFICKCCRGVLWHVILALTGWFLMYLATRRFLDIWHAQNGNLLLCSFHRLWHLHSVPSCLNQDAQLSYCWLCHTGPHLHGIPIVWHCFWVLHWFLWLNWVEICCSKFDEYFIKYQRQCLGSFDLALPSFPFNNHWKLFLLVLLIPSSVIGDWHHSHFLFIFCSDTGNLYLNTQSCGAQIMITCHLVSLHWNIPKMSPFALMVPFASAVNHHYEYILNIQRVSKILGPLPIQKQSRVVTFSSL